MSDEYVRMKKSTMDSIAKAIQEKEGSTDPIPGAEMPARIEALGGGENLADYAKAIQFPSLNVFGKSKVEVDLKNVTTLTRFCSMADANNPSTKNTVVEELTVNCPHYNGSMAFFLDCGSRNQDEKLKRVIINADTAGTTQYHYAFSRMLALESIEGTPLDLSNAQQAETCFERCTALREVRFKGGIRCSLGIHYATKLSKASILSAMGLLMDTLSGQTLTLSQTAVDTAFETSEGAADGSTSAEWLALVDAKPNWTISLRS